MSVFAKVESKNREMWGYTVNRDVIKNSKVQILQNSRVGEKFDYIESVIDDNEKAKLLVS